MDKETVQYRSQILDVESSDDFSKHQIILIPNTLIYTLYDTKKSVFWHHADSEGILKSCNIAINIVLRRHDVVALEKIDADKM